MERAKKAIVVGGGFYGTAIAVHLAERGFAVTVVERGPQLLSRASFANQARLHNGYHYPRSFRTAIRSRANLPHFRKLFGIAVEDRFRALYAIARDGSKVSARHFQRFCAAARIPLRPAKRPDRNIFDSRLIEDVYEVDEPAFNAEVLKAEITRMISARNVRLLLNSPAEGIRPATLSEKTLEIRLASGESLQADWVFNCTYASLNHIDGGRNIARARLRHQIAEVALIRPPAELHDRGITVLDGPFFSTMPFPPRALHSLTHVRHSHHVTWIEGFGVQEASTNRHPFAVLEDYLGSATTTKQRSRVEWMIRDARRFVPALGAAQPVESLFEVKTLVAETEIDDARPIYFRRDAEMPRLISILGSKIDNIFDILSYIDDAIGTSL